MKTWGDRATATNKDYEGETINTNLIIQGGQKHFETQYFPRRVWHDTQGKPAFIIGNGKSREDFDLEYLRGKGTTYGCNAVYRDFTPDYLVSLDRNISQEIAENYDVENLPAYSININQKRYSEHFILVPRNPVMNTGATATHIARFDGHSKIYLLGFDSYNTDPNKTNNVYVNTNAYAKEEETYEYDLWTRQMVTLFTKYKDVQFYRVGSKIIDAYNNLDNVIHIKYDEFKNMI